MVKAINTINIEGPPKCQVNTNEQTADKIQVFDPVENVNFRYLFKTGKWEYNPCSSTNIKEKHVKMRGKKIHQI
jgi:hypothetical protein